MQDMMQGLEFDRGWVVIEDIEVTGSRLSLFFSHLILGYRYNMV